MNYIRAENCGNLDFLNQPSNYQEKLRCHAHDGRTEEDGKWKIEQCSGRPETAIDGPYPISMVSNVSDRHRTGLRFSFRAAEVRFLE